MLYQLSYAHHIEWKNLPSGKFFNDFAEAL